MGCISMGGVSVNSEERIGEINVYLSSCENLLSYDFSKEELDLILDGAREFWYKVSKAYDKKNKKEQIDDHVELFAALEKKLNVLISCRDAANVSKLRNMIILLLAYCPVDSKYYAEAKQLLEDTNESC